MEPSRNESWVWGRARAAFTLDARSLAAYRIALGAILCLDCLLRTRDFGLMFAVDGILPPDAVRGLLGESTLWSLAFLHDTTWWNGVVLGLEGVAGVLLAAGVATPFATCAAWVAVVSVVRRTAPAANAGDLWLACQLFWSMFIPLGAAWSWDEHHRRPRVAGRRPAAFCSVATAALVLQLVVVYVSAGCAKCNASWTGGHALANSLSVHDHGTALGMALGRSGLVDGPLTWAVIAFEVAAPLFLLGWPTDRARLAVAAAFGAFHVAIFFLMSVGLFVPISLVAWLPLLPATLWRRLPGRSAGTLARGLSRPAAWTCGAALALASISLLNARWWGGTLPRPVARSINLAALDQDWGMFGRVAETEQWVYARAVRVDGTVVDLLRGGRPCADDRPPDGFTSLPHHRWHRVCWLLGTPRMRGVAREVAAGLARHWNAVHWGAERVASVELRRATHGSGAGDAAEHEYIVASWPERTATGEGNLARFLDELAADDPG